MFVCLFVLGKCYFYDNYFDLPGALLCARVVDSLTKVSGRSGFFFFFFFKKKIFFSDTGPPGNPSQMHTPDPDAIVDAEKCLLTGA